MSRGKGKNCFFETNISFIFGVFFWKLVEFAEKYNATFFETSAKKNINIAELFDCIGK